MKNKFRLLAPCYFSFFMNGLLALLVGAVLPYIIEEKGLNYSTAGGLLSAFAIGNFLASFINPILAPRIGRRATILLLTGLIPIGFYGLSLLPAVPVMCLFLLFLGIGRGSCSILCNTVINDNMSDKPGALSPLHAVFSVGAFLASFLNSLFINNGFSWRAVVYTLIAGWILAIAGFIWMQFDYIYPVKSQKTGKTDYSFLQNRDFYIIGFLLFFYLGLENCVNGWFMTYFRNSGIMSDTYAANLVSVVWIMVMIGRLLMGKLSARYPVSRLILINCLATVGFFLLLIATNQLTFITAAITGLGFFFAGIYPACIASMGKILKGSTAGMSYLLAIAALGGIITPKIVGILADRLGMQTGIGILAVNVILMVILAIWNHRRRRLSDRV